MNPEQEMQLIVEAAGECYHEWIIKDSTLESKDILGGHYYGGHGYECACGFRRVNRVNWAIGDKANLSGKCTNPSPTDLNELFRLAEKLDINLTINVTKMGSCIAKIHGRRSPVSSEWCKSAHEAILKALVQAIQGGK